MKRKSTASSSNKSGKKAKVCAVEKEKAAKYAAAITSAPKGLINPKNLCCSGVIQQVLINSNKLLDLIYRLPMECAPPG